MYSNSTWSLFANCQELLQNFISRGRSVREEKIFVLEAVSSKPFGIIYFAVESNNCNDTMQTKVWEIGLRSMKRIPIINFALWMWSTKSNKLFWDQPIKVSILNFFVMFILFAIKIVKIKVSSLKYQLIL